MTTFNELNWGIIEIFYLILIFFTGFLVTLLILPSLIRYMKKKGNVGYDIHKNAKPEIAESGGLSIVIGLIVSSSISILLFPTLIPIILIFLLTIILAATIGIVDDIKKLRSRYKILLTILTGFPIFIANYFGFIEIQSPTLPFLGKTRLTLIYPFLIPFIVAVFANSTNMLEGYNGEGSGTCLIAVIFLLICCLIWNTVEGILFTIIAISVLIPFYKYNKFPAKVFPGDVGTLCMGAMVACIALFGSIEVAVFCTFLMHIFNSFYVLSSLKGFFESSNVKEIKKDIMLINDDYIKASFQKKAVLTLPRLILAKGPLKEKQLVDNFYAISVICGYFSVIATLFMVWTNKKIDLIIIIIVIIILLFPTITILIKFDRIRGIIFLMVLILILGVILLIFIDIYIMTLPFADLDLLFAKIPINLLVSTLLFVPGLILWYFITIKYFWIQINKIKRKEI